MRKRGPQDLRAPLPAWQHPLAGSAGQRQRHPYPFQGQVLVKKPQCERKGRCSEAARGLTLAMCLDHEEPGSVPRTKVGSGVKWSLGIGAARVLGPEQS